MIVGGDIGGTKTLLGLFEHVAGAERPRVVVRHSYATGEYARFGDIVDEFMQAVGRGVTIDAAAIGVAGPVVAGAATLTNVSWDVNDSEIAARLGTNRVQVLNDLEALANGVDTLTAEEVSVLQAGAGRTDGNAAVIAAGTGLGQALLHRCAGRLRPVPSEGGHADYAARTDREIELAFQGTSKLGHDLDRRVAARLRYFVLDQIGKVVEQPQVRFSRKAAP